MFGLWNESSQVLVANALMPAKVSEIALCFELGRATVVVDEDQLSLAIGKHGQNVRLAARLTGWDIDILTPEEYNQGIEKLTNCVKTVEGADDMVIDKLIALGVISLGDIDDVGAEPLINELKINAETAEKLVTTAVKEIKRLEAESKQNKEIERLEAESKQNKEIEQLEAESKQNEAEKQLAQQTKATDGETKATDGETKVTDNETKVTDNEAKVTDNKQ